jgi:hypothetical protein
MPLLRLTAEQIAEFARKPETAMDVHIVEVSSGDGGIGWWLVIGCSILMVPDPDAREQMSALMREGRPMWRGKGETAVGVFERWRAGLGSTADFPGASNIAHMVIHPAHRVYRPFPVPSFGVYGHLPFVGTTEPNEVYYRCECWPTSRRVDLTNAKVSGGTFAFPASELPLVPSGFAAVARYALPDLPPACTRYELRPPTNTVVDCGASVPLYGQAGGGVEVCFHRDFTNVGAIANPVLLPVM